VWTAARTGSWRDAYAAAYTINEGETDTATWLTASGAFDWHKVTHSYDPTYPSLETGSTDYGDTGATNTNTSTTDDVCTKVSYAAPDTTKWMIDYPTQMLTTDCATHVFDFDILAGSQTFWTGRPRRRRPRRWVCRP
jgi:hypothetical protein